MTLRLTLLCHASTTALRAASFPRDEPLDGFGAADAQAAAAPLRVDRCWTAPETRARETAAALGLQAEICAALADCDYGRWKGRTLAAIGEEEPQALLTWLNEPDAAPHGGESLAQLLGRVGTWLEQLPQPDATRSLRITGVTHPAVIRAAIVCAIAATPLSFWRIDVAPLSCTELLGDGRRWVLRRTGQRLGYPRRAADG